MSEIIEKSPSQQFAEATVDAFRKQLGPFVVAAQTTRMPMLFTNGAPDHPIIFVNDAFLALTGYSREEMLGQHFQALLAKGVDEDARAALERAFDGDCEVEPEIHYRRENGTEFWASVFVSPVNDHQGKTVQHFVSLIDLTAQRREDARCKVLIDELNHRVKNTLATVQSIVAQGLHRAPDVSSAQEAIEMRLLALSRSHDLLTQQNWEGAGLRDLVNAVMEPFSDVAGRSARFTLRGKNIALPPNTILAVAIALHELATNAVKYGAFSNDVGTIKIEWCPVTAASGQRLTLLWEEQHGPPVTPPTHKGFGTWVIERGLTHELGGHVTLKYLEHGVVCLIDIPAPARILE